MAHDHAYLICENKCLVPGYSAEQIDELLRKGSVALIDKNTGEKYSLWVGTKEEYDAIVVKDPHTIYHKTNDETVPSAIHANSADVANGLLITESKTVGVKILSYENHNYRLAVYNDGEEIGVATLSVYSADVADVAIKVNTIVRQATVITDAGLYAVNIRNKGSAEISTVMLSISSLDSDVVGWGGYYDGHTNACGVSYSNGVISIDDTEHFAIWEIRLVTKY